MNAFETAIFRDFGEWEDFTRILAQSLRQNCGGRVFLLLMADSTLRLAGTKDTAAASGTVLLDLAAPKTPCSEEALALRVRVIDWRHCARRYEEALAQQLHSDAP